MTAEKFDLILGWNHCEWVFPWPSHDDLRRCKSQVAELVPRGCVLQIDTDRRDDARLRDPDYDSHLGVLRDPVTREVVVQATHT
jgi:hypothetical protein